jgi:hypothetical protein
MFGYSRVEYEVFTLGRDIPREISAKVQVNTKICRLGELTARHWRRLRELQGTFGTLYLRLRYGSADTHVLLAFVEEELVHVEWIVPAQKIRKRYWFVENNSYSIISCLTAKKFRGRRIYTSQIQEVARSDIPAKAFWIWTATANIPSLKAIRKAGAVKVAELVQKKWFWGIISSIEYFPE